MCNLHIRLLLMMDSFNDELWAMTHLIGLLHSLGEKMTPLGPPHLVARVGETIRSMWGKTIDFIDLFGIT